eukprot:g1129.t1
MSILYTDEGGYCEGVDQIKTKTASKTRKPGYCAVNSTNPEDWIDVDNLAYYFSPFVRPQFGVHPWWASKVHKTTKEGLQWLEEKLNQHHHGDVSDLNDDLQSPKQKDDSITTNLQKTLVINDSSSPPLAHQAPPPQSFRSTHWVGQLVELLHHRPLAGIGESGLCRSPKGLNASPLDVQIDVFRIQLRIAKWLNRPISLHCVKAYTHIIDILQDEGFLPLSRKKKKKKRDHKGHQSPASKKSDSDSKDYYGSKRLRKYTDYPPVIMHSFAGSLSDVAQLSQNGTSNVYFSFSAMVTNPSRLKKIGPIIHNIPLNRILIETDCPSQPPWQPKEPKGSKEPKEPKEKSKEEEEEECKKDSRKQKALLKGRKDLSEKTKEENDDLIDDGNSCLCAAIAEKKIKQSAPPRVCLPGDIQKTAMIVVSEILQTSKGKVMNEEQILAILFENSKRVFCSESA